MRLSMTRGDADCVTAVLAVLVVLDADNDGADEEDVVGIKCWLSETAAAAVAAAAE